VDHLVQIQALVELGYSFYNLERVHIMVPVVTVMVVVIHHKVKLLTLLVVLQILEQAAADLMVEDHTETVDLV
jgi:hypothetical protein